MRISDWSSDVCSSDLLAEAGWRLFGGFLDLDMVDTRFRRAAPAARDQRVDGLFGPTDKSFHGAVRAVPHPTVHPKRACRIHRPAAEKHALHAAMDEEALGDRKGVVWGKSV